MRAGRAGRACGTHYAVAAVAGRDGEASATLRGRRRSGRYRATEKLPNGGRWTPRVRCTQSHDNWQGAGISLNTPAARWSRRPPTAQTVATVCCKSMTEWIYLPPTLTACVSGSNYQARLTSWSGVNVRTAANSIPAPASTFAYAGVGSRRSQCAMASASASGASSPIRCRRENPPSGNTSTRTAETVSVEVNRNRLCPSGEICVSGRISRQGSPSSLRPDSRTRPGAFPRKYPVSMST